MHLAHEIVGLEHASHGVGQRESHSHRQSLRHGYDNQRDGYHDRLEKISHKTEPLEIHVDEIECYTSGNDEYAYHVGEFRDKSSKAFELLVERRLQPVIYLGGFEDLAVFCGVADLKDAHHAVAFHYLRATHYMVGGECGFRFLYDADIDFTGRCGAVMMYARQKGASEEELILLEEGMNNVAVRMEIGSGVAGLGAAGGAGGGLYAFLGAEGVRGIDIVLDAACFDVHLHNADLVITGEGKADAQTSQGKVAKGVLSRAARAGVPVALLAGRIDDRRQLCSEGYGHIADINENMDGGERTLDPLDPLVAADRLARASRRLASSLKM